MGLIKLLKKIIGSSEEKLENPLNLKINDLKDWIKKKNNENFNKENEIVEKIKQLISNLILELKEEQEIIKKVDLKERKAEERVKIIVLNNLANYSSFVENLIFSLEKIDSSNLDRIVADINKIFLEFKQKSHMSFEKANFLVGDEIKNVKESIRIFFEKLTQISNDEKEFLEKVKIIKNIGDIILELENNNNSKNNLESGIKIINDDLQSKIKAKDEKQKKIDEIKKSKEYLEEIKEKESAELKKKEITAEISNLRHKIDFKSLTKNFHGIEKKMNLIRTYENDFNQIFDKDSKILDFFEGEEKRNIENIILKIKKDKEDTEITLNRKDPLTEIKILLNENQQEIEDTLENKKREEDKMQKINENISKLTEEMSLQLKKLNITLDNNP